MARKVIGQVYMSKDKEKSNFIKIRDDLAEPLVLQAGQFIQVESKAYKIASLKKAMEAGKMSAEMGAEILARHEEIPKNVLGELVLVTK